jgi:hypothetical protein
MKLTREQFIARKEAAAQANVSGWDLTPTSPMIRHHFRPNNPGRGTYMWMGIRALHKRNGMGTESFHMAYAIG